MPRKPTGNPTGRPYIAAYDRVSKVCERCGRDFYLREQRYQSYAKFMRRKFCNTECAKGQTLRGNPNLFWTRLDTSNPEACWEWPGKRTSKGYGQCEFEGKTSRAHRVAYRLAKGEIPAGLMVRHDCDNPPCCNPAHLRVGTAADNMRDAIERGRVPYSRMRVLTDADRSKIASSTLTLKQLAAEIGCSVTSVWNVRRNLSQGEPRSAQEALGDNHATV